MCGKEGERNSSVTPSWCGEVAVGVFSSCSACDRLFPSSSSAVLLRWAHAARYSTLSDHVQASSFPFYHAAAAVVTELLLPPPPPPRVCRFGLSVCRSVGRSVFCHTARPTSQSSSQSVCLSVVSQPESLALARLTGSGFD